MHLAQKRPAGLQESRQPSQPLPEGTPLVSTESWLLKVQRVSPPPRIPVQCAI